MNVSRNDPDDIIVKTFAIRVLSYKCLINILNLSFLAGTLKM